MPTQPIYDAIVLGCGGMGSATLYDLAARGLKVLGLEQFSLVHNRGSSHGRTRVIRTAYYEHPDYVPLLHRAFDKWYDLEYTLGRHLLTECGCLSIGPETGQLIAGVLASAQRHSLAVTKLTARDIEQLELPFRLSESDCGAYEEQAGFLAVEDCVRAQLDAALACGATIESECEVIAWHATEREVTVETTRGTFKSAKLAITAGAWATQLLTGLGVRLSVMRQVQQWFKPHDPERFRRDRMPVFLHDSPLGSFYGIPMIDPRGVKVAQHYGAPELTSPNDVDWTPSVQDETPVRAFLDAHMPGVGACIAQEVCMYTLSPDRHFIIDVHPHHPNVAIASGFSGHGFKFCPIVGQLMGELLFQESTSLESNLFRLARFSSKGS